MLIILQALRTWSAYIIWAIALIAMFGSLYISEVMGLPPCNLCWYQRILIYPLVLLVPVGILRKDPNLPYYILPFGIVGAGFALFHSLLQWGVIPEKAAQCVNGVSCADVQINLLGFITIPFMSLLAFLAVIALASVMIWPKKPQV